MSDLNLTLFALGALTLLLSLLSGFVKRKVYPVSEPMLALGVLLGPYGFKLLEIADWGEPRGILETAARLTVAVSVMATALRLPKGYFPNNVSALLALLGPGMLLMWLTSGLLAWWLLDVPFWLGLLVGAVLTPTDPVVSGTIVTGETAKKYIPARLRNLLSAEAGANDGGAYVFVFLCLLMLERSPGEALLEWTTRVLLWKVLAAAVIGYLLGYAAGRLQKWAEQRDFVETSSLFTVTIALTAVVLAGVALLGGNGILAVFAAGLAFNRAVGEPEEDEQTAVQEAVNRLFSFPVLVLFGMALPWQAWGELGWTGPLLALLLLLLRRLPMMLLLRPFMSPLQRRADVLFTGWFGPVGVAAVFYAAHTSERLGSDLVWNVCSLVVAASVVAFGVTSTPFTLLYERLSNSKQDGKQDGARDDA